MQNELSQPAALLDPSGKLAQVGWSRQPILDPNLEAAHFYRLRFAQRYRMKRWDYYAIFTPSRFFSATIADLGYAGNIFVYTLDFTSGQLHEEGLVVPFGRGLVLPRTSLAGESHFSDKRASLDFRVTPGARQLSVSWPGFDSGRGIQAEINLGQPTDHESMTIVIPIGQSFFYYNHKVNCLPASGYIQYGDQREELAPETCFGQLDWGRGVWDYRSFWNWASASGRSSDGRPLGLNLGCGFGDTSRATENSFILDGRLHKLDQVQFDYHSGDYMQPWKFRDNENRLDLEFTPFKERLAVTNLGVIFSEVHQMFGRYHGRVVTDQNEIVQVENLIGFAEEHQARW